jgi:hypothetical protein
MAHGRTIAPRRESRQTVPGERQEKPDLLPGMQPALAFKVAARNGNAPVSGGIS